MKQAELQHYRAMLQAQAAEAPAKRRLFGEPSGPVLVRMVEGDAGLPPRPSLSPRRVSLFGRRRPALSPPTVAEPLLLETPVVEPEARAQRLRFGTPVTAGHFTETPFHAEDLADPTPSGPMPGVIAGWSAAKPPNAQLRLLRRLCAVLEAERGGLAARLEAAGVTPA